MLNACILNSDSYFPWKAQVFIRSGKCFIILFFFSFETITKTKTKNVVGMGFEKCKGTFSLNTVSEGANGRDQECWMFFNMGTCWHSTVRAHLGLLRNTELHVPRGYFSFGRNFLPPPLLREVVVWWKNRNTRLNERKLSL